MMRHMYILRNDSCYITTMMSYKLRPSNPDAIPLFSDVCKTTSDFKTSLLICCLVFIRHIYTEYSADKREKHYPIFALSPTAKCATAACDSSPNPCLHSRLANLDTRGCVCETASRTRAPVGECSRRQDGSAVRDRTAWAISD